jgi:F0F1-type ATP synthase membrane subunit c/vacuolar-type H+-ATPase subunit K
VIGQLINYSSLGATVALSSFGVALGSSLIGTSSLKALYFQPTADKEISKASLIAMALTETGGILSLAIAILMLISSDKTPEIGLHHGLGRLGIFFAVGIISCCVGIVSSLPARKACFSIARQPFFSTPILNVMLITMSIMQTPILFGFVISAWINQLALSITTNYEAIGLLCAGICIGIGSIGPVIGQGIYAAQACTSLGKNRMIYRRILTFSLISQAIIESPAIFALITSILILNSISQELSLLKTILFAAATFCVSIAAITPSISSGRTSSSACEQITAQPQHYSILMQTSLIAQGILDTFAIYGLVVGLILLLLIR